MKADDVLDRPAIALLADQMARNGIHREAPVRSVMALLGDRWSTLILLILGTGDCRHAPLRRALASLSSERAISQRVLTLKLRTLERDGLVVRSVSADVPPKVGYALTPLGRDLLQQTGTMIAWIEGRTAVINAARKAFDDLSSD